MSVTFHARLVCDRCGRPFGTAPVNDEPAAKLSASYVLLKMARERGWTGTTDHIECPQCQKKKPVVAKR